MTPIEQMDLRWIVEDEADQSGTIAFVRRVVLPKLAALIRNGMGPQDYQTASSRNRGEGIAEVMAVASDERDGPEGGFDDPDEIEIHIVMIAHHDVLGAMDVVMGTRTSDLIHRRRRPLPSAPTDAGTPPSGVPAALHRVLNALVDARRTNTTSSAMPSIERTSFEALRIAEETGMTVTDMQADLHAATPLGMGGLHVDVDERVRPRKGNVPQDVTPTPRWARSAELCRPGTVTLRMTRITGSSGRQRHVIRIDSDVHHFRVRPIDPMLRLRLEVENPSEPKI
jgi:hypothetical protein